MVLLSRTLRRGVELRTPIQLNNKNRKLQRRTMRTMFAGLLGAGFACAPVPYAMAQTVELAALSGDNGFKIKGLAEGDELGRSVSIAGDINGDSIDDFVISAPFVNVGSTIDAGAAYVVFGTTNQSSGTFDLSSLNGGNGFRLEGGNFQDLTGISVSRGGDVNGDGYDDILIGCPYCNSKALDNGSVYVVFGKAAFTSGSLALSSL